MVKADESQRKPLVLVQLVLNLASPPVARKRESKRAKQGELMVLPVATPAALRTQRIATCLFIVTTQEIVYRVVGQNQEAIESSLRMERRLSALSPTIHVRWFLATV